jgi:hypothetical protein
LMKSIPSPLMFFLSHSEFQITHLSLPLCPLPPPPLSLSLLQVGSSFFLMDQFCCHFCNFDFAFFSFMLKP